MLSGLIRTIRILCFETMTVDHLQINARRASGLLKAMSNERRLMILCQLGRGECSVGELERKVGLSQSALSQHLARLRQDGLVTTRRHAQTIYYSLHGGEAQAILRTLHDLFCAEAVPNGQASVPHEPPQRDAGGDPAAPKAYA